MKPTSYVDVIRKRWLTIALTTLVCLLIGGAVTLLMPKKYQATAQIFVSVSHATDTGALNSANSFTVARVQSYVSVVNSPQVTDFVATQLNLPKSLHVAKEITANAPLNKVLINITVTDRYADRAAAIATAAANRMVTVVQDLESAKQGTKGSPVALTVTKPANVPGSPTQPRPSLNLGLALLVGLLLGFGIAVARERLDDRVRTTEELEELSQLPILASLPSDGVSLRRGGEPFERDWLPRHVFTQLQASLPFVNLDKPPRSLCVVSPSPGDGKTYVALNLALALARNGDPVCILEGNLRSPELISLLKLPRKVGLTSVLTGHETIDRAVQPLREGLSVIAAGPVPPNPASVFGSEKAQLAMAAVASAFRYTVIDTAAILSVDDARVCDLADATLLVVRRGHTRRRDLQRTVAALQAVGVRPAGVVFTMARRRSVMRSNGVSSDPASQVKSRPAPATAAQS